MNWIQGLATTAVFAFSVQLLASPTTVEAKEFKTLGNPKAPVRGTFSYSFSAEPENLNPINSTDYYSSQIQDYTCDSLMTLNAETYEWMPALAESFSVGKNAMSYTFKLRKGVKFHDGTPLTAKDVKFSFDAIRNPAYKASHRVPYFENFESVEVIDDHTVRVNIKKKYFKNFEMVAGGLPVVPQKAYGNPKKKMSKKIICSGPYKMGKYNKSKSIELVRNNDWWGWKVPHMAGKYNFKKRMVRFLKEENLQIQMMEKGQLDFLALGKEAFYKKTTNPPWGKTIKKVEIENRAPKGYGFVGFNLLDEKFKDKKVRKALAHLLNRELINEKFRYGKSDLATGPWYRFSLYADQNVRPLMFEPDTAKKLLEQAGWKDSDKNGVRDKLVNGKKAEFSFTLLLPNKDVEKYFTLYKEDLKKAGIKMNIQYVEWNTFLKSVDDKKFEALAMGWGGGSVHLDPKQIWHTDSARKGGSNFISYSNPEVDKLIDQGRDVLDHNKRAKLFKRVYKLIAEDVPYIFLFNDKYVQYGLAPRVGQVKPTYKFDLGQEYWWAAK